MLISKMYVLVGTPLFAFDFSLDGTEDGMIEEPAIGVLIESNYFLLIVSYEGIILWSTEMEVIRASLVDKYWVILENNEGTKTVSLLGSFDGYNDGNI